MVTLRKALVVLCFSALLSASAFGYNAYYLPQVAVGVGGELRFITQISIFNDWAQPVEMSAAFLNNDGHAWTVSTSCAENDNLNGSNSSLMFIMPADEKYTISMTSADGFQIGWVVIVSELPVAVTATYGFYERLPGTIGKVPSQPLWEAAVLPAPAAMQVKFAAHSRRNDTIFGVDVNTGFAVSNTNAVPVLVTAKIWNEAGELLGIRTFTLPGWGHRAQFINELFDGIDLTDVRAVVELHAEGPIAVLAMKEAKRLEKVVYSTVAVNPSSDQVIGLDYDREPNNSPNVSTSISAPTQIYGTLCGDDNIDNNYFDYYRIQLTAGQRIEVILLAGSLGSPLDPSLTLRNMEDLQMAASSELLPDSRDRKLVYTATATGSHFIRIGRTTPTESLTSFYRMFVRVF